LKRTIHRLSYFVAGFLFILLILKDFFPNIFVSNDILFWGILLCVLTNFITNPNPILKKDKKRSLYSIFTTLSFLILVILLMLSGRESQSGITTHPIFWILAIAAVIKSIVKYQKFKRNNPNKVL
jgi:hypothetical protein